MSNIGEAYRKKLYPAHFVLKITDSGWQYAIGSDAENSETRIARNEEVWTQPLLLRQLIWIVYGSTGTKIKHA